MYIYIYIYTYVYISIDFELFLVLTVSGSLRFYPIWLMMGIVTTKRRGWVLVDSFNEKDWAIGLKGTLAPMSDKPKVT